MILDVPWLAAARSCKPRASGDDPKMMGQHHDRARVNPARAGMIRETAQARVGLSRKPRASGDDPPFGRKLLQWVL